MAHPAVMFESMADSKEHFTALYTGVSGWRIEYARTGFGYVQFSPVTYHFMGSTGQAGGGNWR